MPAVRRIPRVPWARIGRLVLTGCVLLLAFIGLLTLTRGTAVRHVRGIAVDGVPVAVGEPAFALAAAMATNTPLTRGNRVEVRLDGKGTFTQLWADLRSAQSTIALQMYYGQQGQVGDKLREILLERAAAGVRVFVLYDAFGAQGIPKASLDAYRKAGVVAAPFRPFRLSSLHLFQNRSHVRGVAIDGKIGWTGGFGIDDKWLGDGRSNGSWRETNVRFEGPAVIQLLAGFAAAWTEATGNLFTGRPTVSEYPDGAVAGFLYATPTLGSTAAERFMALSIAGARKTLYITNAYFAPDRNFIELLVAAARRGVDVRLLTSGESTDVDTVRYAGRAWYGMLLSAGVRVYEWQPTTLHSKTMVVDGLWSAIGSINFDNRSMALNDESALMTLDGKVGAEMDRLFLDDLRLASEITADAFRQRSWFQKIGEWGAGLFRRVL